MSWRRLPARSFSHRAFLRAVAESIGGLGISNRLRAMGSRAYRRHFVDPELADLAHSVLLLGSGPGGATIIELTLGARIANGFSGTVYHLASLRGPGPALPEGLEAVVKMSNRSSAEGHVNGPGRRDGSLRREFAIERSFLRQIPRLWRTPELEALSDCWRRGRLPVAPAIRMLDTADGVFLIKPLVQGLSLGDIRRQYGFRDVPSEMIGGLRIIHHLGQAIHEHLEVPARFDRTGAARPYSLDLKPDNLVWVERADMLKRFGLRKPGYVLVEIDHFPSGAWIYSSSRFTFRSYHKLFLDYLRAARDGP